MPRPLPKRASRVGLGRGKGLEQPAGAGRNKTVERGEPRREWIRPIDRLAYIVHQRRGEQFLVERPLRMHMIECLQRVLERIAFRMPRRILPQAGQRPQQISDAIEAIAHEVAEAAADFFV